MYHWTKIGDLHTTDRYLPLAPRMVSYQCEDADLTVRQYYEGHFDISIESTHQTIAELKSLLESITYLGLSFAQDVEVVQTEADAFQPLDSMILTPTKRNLQVNSVFTSLILGTIFNADSLKHYRSELLDEVRTAHFNPPEPYNAPKRPPALKRVW